MARRGWARLGTAWHGAARQGTWQGRAGLGSAWHGKARNMGAVGIVSTAQKQQRQGERYEQI